MSKGRPNVVGKGPALTREMITIFEEIEQMDKAISSETMNEIQSGLKERAETLRKIVKMAYLKTVKAGEIAWDLKEQANELKAVIEEGNELRALELYRDLVANLDDFIKKIKSFVVRMT